MHIPCQYSTKRPVRGVLSLTTSLGGECGVDHGFDRGVRESAFDGLGVAVFVDQEGTWGSGHTSCSTFGSIAVNDGQCAVRAHAVVEFCKIQIKILGQLH